MLGLCHINSLVLFQGKELPSVGESVIKRIIKKKKCLI